VAKRKNEKMKSLGCFHREQLYDRKSKGNTPRKTQEKPKSTPIVVVTAIVAHSTSFSSRPKTTGYKWWNGA